MAKMSYGDQLKHPNWQKKRLEVFEAYGFKCAVCESTEKMLHVHHKQYIKGRQAWDYPIENFEALCDGCHKEAHEAKDRVNAILAQMPTMMWEGVAALLAGWAREYVDQETRESTSDTHSYLCGEMAWHVANLDDFDVQEACDSFGQLGPDGFLEALRTAVRKGMA